ncbi:hypothetical protein ciss_01510 [Carboxydothermus islandicus]|uniref:Uncharacterized protein n=1 Tax=Carboxydothermus islandicus TaxID=661089 RepID=A0A1L8CZ84_9THEO|nr:hypothetical protein [Carboxydothermus islandicus]GAV24218.1 hypothetical protein ciss_01510 [Carboxydothermus islandicus]
MRKIAVLTLMIFVWAMLFATLPVKPALAATVTVSTDNKGDTSPTLSSIKGKFTTPPAPPENKKNVAITFNVYGFISTTSGGNKIYVLWDGAFAYTTNKLNLHDISHSHHI